MAWPSVLLIFGLFFGKELKSLITSIANLGNRSKKISYKGINLDLGAPNLPIGEQQNNARQQEIMEAFQPRIIAYEEKTIRTRLAEANFTDEQVRPLRGNLFITEIFEL